MRGGLDWIVRVRLASGIVLFVYVATHLLNHAFGVISLDAMEWGRLYFLAAWRNPVGTALLYGSLVVHLGLVLYTIYRRRTLRMPLREALQIVAGLAIPPLLALHVVGNRGLHEFHDVNDMYAYVLIAILSDPFEGFRLMVALLVTWFHGCIGFHFWLKLKPWYPKLAPWLLSIALLWPAFALAGVATALKEVIYLLETPLWIGQVAAEINFPSDDSVAWALRTLSIGYWSQAGLLVLVLALRIGRQLVARRANSLTITYPGGRKVTVAPGLSVLEASRSAGIPHASVCGGRGRCSTCRVRIAHGLEHLAPASEEEARVLKRVGTPANVRLACQIRPNQDVTVTPLLAPTAQPADGHRRPAYLQGTEREIAILFADMRAFTKFSEKKLPYDVVFVLNQYFRAMGAPIERTGGQLDKFIGRRRHGVVRCPRRRAAGLPRCAAGRPRDGGGPQRAQRDAQRRPTRADAHRHRYSHRRRHRRRDGVCDRAVGNGDRRCGEHRKSPRDEQQGIPQPARGLSRGRNPCQGRPLGVPRAQPGGAGADRADAGLRDRGRRCTA